MNNSEVCIILNMISGIGYSRYSKLIEKFVSPPNILTASLKDLQSVQGIGKELAKSISNWESKVDFDKEMKFVDRAGVEIITLADDKYPTQLKEIFDPPLCLYVRGALDCDFDNTIAMVGSRRVTSYGKEMAEFLSTALSNAGWTVVSGLAYGIDAICHEGVVNSKGKTIAVLGGGLARLHPQDHAGLARNIIENGGAVISEFPMELSPTRQTFPMRNRVISGLSQGVVVVEAGMKSGSLITANFALEHGRTVFAVPGRANDPLFRGTNKLIKDGAKLTESIEDILEEFEFLPGFSQKEKADKKVGNKAQTNLKPVAKKEVNLSPEEKLIMDSIKYEEKNVDNISLETAIPIGKLLSFLLKLEMKQQVKQLPGKIFKLK